MIKELLKKDIVNKFMKFFIIGLGNTAIFNITFIILLKVGIQYSFSTTIAFMIGVSFSYVVNCKFNYKVKMRLRTALLFPVSYIPNLIITLVGSAILVELLFVPKVYSAFLASLFALPITFLLQKFLLDRKKNNDETT